MLLSPLGSLGKGPRPLFCRMGVWYMGKLPRVMLSRNGWDAANISESSLGCNVCPLWGAMSAFRSI